MSDEFNIDQVISVDFEADSELNVQVGSSFQGASIDDTVISTKKTWSSQKISDELDTKADDSATTAALALKADSADVYTKTQTYSKTEVDTALGDKPDAWEGTQAEYDALSEKDPDTIYFITDTNGSGQNFQPVIYSTEEREIGVYLDGKPLYCKVLVNSSTVTANNNVWTTIPLNNQPENIDKFVFGALLADAYPVSYEQPRILYDSENAFFKMASVQNSSYVAGKLLIYAEYTKTTDTAGSGTWTPQGVPAIHYSTDEQIVGVWIDGSTLYQKTINVDAISSDTTVAHGIANLNTIIDYSGFGVYGAGDKAVMPFQNPANSTGFGLNYYDATNLYLKKSSGLGSNFSGCYLTIRYTKSST